MRHLVLPLLLTALVTTSPAIAKGRSAETGYIDDIDQRCQVWAPSMLGRNDFALRYTGACKNGRAEGKGKAEWLYRYAEMKLKAAWEGEFRNGVFLDGQKIKGSIEPIAGDKYIVAMGTIANAELYFVSRSPQDGPMALCNIDQIGLLPDAKTDLSDDTKVKALMDASIKAYQTTCPTGTRDANIGIFTEPLKPRQNGMLPNAIATGRYDPDTGKLSRYSNSAAEKARQAKQQADYAAQQIEARKKFMAFSRQHGVVAWVTARQIEENPFRWEGKTVGVIVRVNRMVTRDTALIQNAFGDWWPDLQLTGITPEFPDSRRSVLLAATMGKRERLADATDSKPTFVTLHHVASQVCERDGCGEWLTWAQDGNDLTWGEPFNAH